jgi:hypothetical protein
MRWGEPSELTSLMSGGLIASGASGIGFSPSATTSAPVSTVSTPGMAFAAVVSIAAMRAWARVERTTTPWA